MKKLILRDRDGVDYKVKDQKRFSCYIFNVHGEGLFIHKEECHYFPVNGDFREKIRNFLF